MANPTTNYGFVLPTATDLVTDLPADFDVALQGVDTRLKALQPGTTLGDLAYSSATANTNTRLGIGTSGQVLAVSGGGVPAWTTPATPATSGLACIKAETAFSAVTSFTVDSIFTSTYTNYMLVMRYTTSASNNPALQFRVGGVTATTNYNSQFFAGDNTSADIARLTAQSSILFARSTGGDFKAYVTGQISGPFLTEPTLVAVQVAANAGAYTSPISQQNIHNHSTATSYDGFIMSVPTGTFTGSYAIYGYSKAV